MKIRTGFVSNSSTTSFCIFGIYLEDQIELKKVVLSMLPDDWSIDNDDNLDLHDVLVELSLDLEAYPLPDTVDEYYIGTSAWRIKDDETGLEFKRNVFNKIKKILPDIEFDKLRYIHDAWRDG